MRRAFGSLVVLVLAAGCPQQQQQSQQPQSFCVQYANTTGFAGQGGHTVIFNAYDANSRSTEFVIPIEYTTTQNDGSPFTGSSFTFDPPADVGSAFASNVLRFTGTPPIEFIASIQGLTLQDAGVTVSCTIPTVLDVFGQMNLGRDVWRVEVTADGSIECVNDQGSCD